MNVAPATEYEAVFAAGVTGLEGTVALGLLDSTGQVAEPLDTADITETPAGSGIYFGTRTAPATVGQYTLLWSIDGTTDPAAVTIEELLVTAAAPDPFPPADMYGTVDELMRILKIRTPTGDQTAAGERVLTTASGEINAEIDRVDDIPGWGFQLVTEVALERAVEHWQQQEVPYGIWENALGPIVVGRDTWDRHALKLAPLKEQWGIA